MGGGGGGKRRGSGVGGEPGLQVTLLEGFHNQFPSPFVTDVSHYSVFLSLMCPTIVYSCH